MSTALKGETIPIPNAEGMRFGIVVSQWNREITGKLLEGAVQALKSNGCREEDIETQWVPGTFELPLGAKYFATYGDVDAVIVLGCVIQGDTKHFDYVCQGVTQGVISLQLEECFPVAFGVLTTNDLQQAVDRAGGVHGNKGAEAAETAIVMVENHSKFQEIYFKSHDENEDDAIVS